MMTASEFWAELCHEEERRKAQRESMREIHEAAQADCRQILRARDLNLAEQFAGADPFTVDRRKS